jgi:hypothetical protein
MKITDRTDKAPVTRFADLKAGDVFWSAHTLGSSRTYLAVLDPRGFADGRLFAAELGTGNWWAPEAGLHVVRLDAEVVVHKVLP